MYCARGDMENRIKEQFALFADRVNDATIATHIGASALARNDHTLLPKSDPPPLDLVSPRRAPRTRSCHRASRPRTRADATFSVPSGDPIRSRKLNALRISGADGVHPSPPSAWMISLAPVLPEGKSCSSCGSVYPSTNGSFLGSSALSVQIKVPLRGRAGRVPAADGSQRAHTFVA